MRLATAGVVTAEGRSSLQLASLLEQIQSAGREADRLVRGRSDEDLTRRVNPDSWSVAECLDHLAQTSRAFLPVISDAVATAPKLTTDRALRTGTLARLFIRNLEPPYHRRLKVLPQLTPRHTDFKSAWSEFNETQTEFSKTVRSAIGLALDKVKIKSPVYARVSYNVYGAFCLLTAHQRRHLWQIEQILRALDCR